MTSERRLVGRFGAHQPYIPFQRHMRLAPSFDAPSSPSTHPPKTTPPIHRQPRSPAPPTSPQWPPTNPLLSPPPAFPLSPQQTPSPSRHLRKARSATSTMPASVASARKRSDVWTPNLQLPTRADSCHRVRRLCPRPHRYRYLEVSHRAQ